VGQIISVRSREFTDIPRRGLEVHTPSPKFVGFEKAETNFKFRGIYVRKKIIRKMISLILKLSGTPRSLCPL
jgi:hypothetical protein